MAVAKERERERERDEEGGEGFPSPTFWTWSRGRKRLRSRCSFRIASRLVSTLLQRCMHQLGYVIYLNLGHKVGFVLFKSIQKCLPEKRTSEREGESELERERESDICRGKNISGRALRPLPPALSPSPCSQTFGENSVPRSPYRTFSIPHSTLYIIYCLDSCACSNVLCRFGLSVVNTEPGHRRKEGSPN